MLNLKLVCFFFAEITKEIGIYGERETEIKSNGITDT